MFLFLRFSSYAFPFSLPLALYDTIPFVVFKDLTVPSTFFYNISTVSLGGKKEQTEEIRRFLQCELF